jgi:hypothetical protein
LLSTSTAIEIRLLDPDSELQLKRERNLLRDSLSYTTLYTVELDDRGRGRLLSLVSFKSSTRVVQQILLHSSRVFSLERRGETNFKELLFLLNKIMVIGL